MGCGCVGHHETAQQFSVWGVGCGLVVEETQQFLIQVLSASDIVTLPTNCSLTLYLESYTMYVDRILQGIYIHNIESVT